jgi:hypothetical protein
MSRILGCPLAACAWLIFVPLGMAQESDDPDEPMPAAPAAAPDVPEFDMDQWIFGGQVADVIRKRFEAALEQDIKRFDGRYGLNPAQKKKLELAGRLDIKRYFDRVEEAKAEYKRVKGDWNKMGNRVVELQQAQNRIFTDVFGDESMLAKTLKKNLTTEQVAGYEKGIYRKRVEWMAGLLNGRLGLSTDQRRGFVDLVVDETLPLKRYGNFDYDAIMFQVSRLPRERLRRVLDERQCRELNLRFDQARRMQSILVSEGYLSAADLPSTGADSGGLKPHHEEARR